MFEAAYKTTDTAGLAMGAGGGGQEDEKQDEERPSSGTGTGDGMGIHFFRRYVNDDLKFASHGNAERARRSRVKVDVIHSSGRLAGQAGGVEIGDVVVMAVEFS